MPAGSSLRTGKLNLEDVKDKHYYSIQHPGKRKRFINTSEIELVQHDDSKRVY